MLSFAFAVAAVSLPFAALGAPTHQQVLAAQSTRPLVLWHGLGDSYASKGMLEFIEMLQSVHEDMFVYSIRLEEDLQKDQQAGFFGDVNAQVLKVCEQLQTIDELAEGFDAMGFSQGGQFLRAYVQNCNSPPVNNLITFGSQHMGISDLPLCKPGDVLCSVARNAARRGVYGTWAQHNLVQAQYFRDPSRLSTYLTANRFLPVLNSELPPHPRPPQRLSLLSSLVLVQFSDERTVIPPASSHFGSVSATNASHVISMREQELYTKDWIGLRELDERGGVVELVCEGQHMQLDKECWEPIVRRWTGGKMG